MYERQGDEGADLHEDAVVGRVGIKLPHRLANVVLARVPGHRDAFAHQPEALEGALLHRNIGERIGSFTDNHHR